ncbi:MAG: M20 family peptidase [Cyclobacteriaceae bacterium]|nr:M20 family peptidase [Cyclobacteriaceae bacterium]
MKSVFRAFLLLLVVLVVVLVINTVRFESKQLNVQAVPAPPLADQALEHFQQAVRIKTISFGDTIPPDSGQFFAFHRFLQSAYPRVHEDLALEKVKDYSLLYKWQGSNPSANPIVLMAHMDVVPVEPGTESIWTVDPFAGEIKNDTIWGRGTTDDKMNLIAIMEAVESLIAGGFKPLQTIYLSFGHDEEVGGTGAIAIANLLKSRNIKAAMVLDEGGIITVDKVPGMKQPVALIGTSEKGYLSLNLSLEEYGGHSSIPAPETSIDILSRAILKLRDNPFDASFSKSTSDFMDYVGPEQPFLQKMFFANRWLFESVIVGIYEGSAGGNAMVRTTIAPTIFNAGVKDNVIPTIAKATINFRLLPGDTRETVIEKVKSTLADDRIKIEPTAFGNEPSKVTPTDGLAFKAVEKAIRTSFDNTIVAPFLMVGATDSRHFSEVSDQIIKFSPMSDPIGFHGIDERISVDGYRHGIWFYEQLIRSFNE